MEKQELLGEDQLAAIGVDSVQAQGVVDYLDTMGVDLANPDRDSMEGQHDLLVEDVAEIIEGSPEQAESLLAHLTPVPEPAEAPPSYIDKLYAELGRIAHLVLPEATVDRVVEHFPHWSYETGRDQEGQFSLLRGRVLYSTKTLDVSRPELPRRQVWRDRDGLTIKVDTITGDNLRYLVGIERLLQRPKPKKQQPKPEIKVRRQLFREEAARFRDAKNVYIDEEDLFTDKESVPLSLMTHFSRYEDIGDALGTSVSKISRILQPVRDRLGLSSNMELMLVAVAAGIASIEHVPKGKIEKAALNKTEMAALSKWYSTNPEERSAVRSKKSSTKSRLCARLGVDWHTAVLYGLRDEKIELPTLNSKDTISTLDS